MVKFSHTILLCITIVFVIISILCHLIAMFTSFWLKSSDAVQTDFLNLGLFNACFDNYLHKHEEPVKSYDGCHDIYGQYYSTIRDWLVPGWLVSCRGLAIVSLILQIAAVVVLCLLIAWWLCKWACCDEKRRDGCERCMIYTAPILFFIAGMFLMTVVIMFADNAFRLQCKDAWVNGDPNNNQLSWSWGFEIAACIFTFITGGLVLWFVVLRAREEY